MDGGTLRHIHLHTFIAENEAGLLSSLTVFPKMVVSSTPREALKYTRLDELEANYELIGGRFPNNCGWYQSRWHMAAAEIHAHGGPMALKNLWKALMAQKADLGEGPFIELLTQVHPSVSDVPLKWDIN